ncbi:MAG: CsgG/HfaB family protein [Planctomycetales bacterium]|nr:CsgG/HfaB family protein [Planctomycetales bacterium]
MRAHNLILVVLAVMLLSGCAPHAKLLVWRPAAEEIQGVNKLVILDLDGEEPYGRIARGALEAQFAQNRHYTLVDPAVLGPARSVKNGEGATDVSAALAAAKTAGVDAVLTGQVVSYKVDDNEQNDSHFSFGESSGKNKRSGTSFNAFGIGIDNNHTVTREASVSLSVKLIDVQSQQVIAVRQSSHNVTAQQVNGEGNLPARERVLTELLTACATDVVSLIAPHYVPAEVTLARQFFGKGMDDVRRGNELAKQGDWTGAAASWEAALKHDPANHAALHNLALAAEARQDFPTAIKNLNKAMASYPATLYHDTQKRLKDEQILYLAAARQVDAKKSAPSLVQQQLPPNTASQSTVPASYETPVRLPAAE